MSTFESLLSKHGTHRRKKKRRRLEKGARGGASETAAATGDKAGLVPRMTLGRAIASLVSRSGAAPRRPNGAPASEAGVLMVALLVDSPSAFPHANIWERWLNACAVSSSRTRVGLVVASREPSSQSGVDEAWPLWAREFVVVPPIPSLARWGSVDELRALLCLIKAAADAADRLDETAPTRIVLCDGGTLPATIDVDALFCSPIQSQDVAPTSVTSMSSASSTDNAGRSSEKSPGMPFSRSIQFDCVHRSVERSRLRRCSPWGLVLSRSQARSLLAADSPEVRGSTAPASWTTLFQSVPCASEIYFATVLTWLEEEGAVERVSGERTCCLQNWNVPISRETDVACVGSAGAFAALVNQTIRKYGHLLFVRRVPGDLKMTLGQWEAACGVESTPSSASMETATPSISGTSAIAFPRAATPAPGQKPQLQFPRGGRGQREAWFSDDYLRSVDPPACGAGNKFFIYSTYRLFALMNRKRLHFHDSRWLDPATFGLPLDVSFDSGDQSENELHRSPTNIDRRLVEAVFRKTTMYLQWSPLVLSWQRTVRPWFKTFMDRAVAASEAAYGSSVRSDRNDTLTIHLRTGDIWEQRVRSANLANGGFVFYTQPPAWFYSWIAERLVSRSLTMEHVGTRLRKAIVVTHVPNSTYTLAVVVALKSVFGLDSVQVCSDSLLADFGLLLRARHFVPSISTFAWWAVFLGNAVLRDDMGTGRAAAGTKRHVYLGLTGFWHPESEHGSRYNFGFDKDSDCGCAERHTFVLEKSDRWQNTDAQRAKAFAFDPPAWFVEKYGSCI